MKIKHFSIALFLIAAILLTLESCRKIIDRGPSSVKGTVVRKSEGKTPVPFATVSLLQKDKNGSLFSMNLKTLEVKQADAKGEYSFDFDAEWGYDYALMAKAEHFEDMIDPQYITAGKTRNEKLELKPYGYVRLRLINKEPADLYNNISIKEWCNNKINFSINSFDTCIICRKISSKEAKISYWVTKTNFSGENINRNFYHTLNIPVLDTTEATIEY